MQKKQAFWKESKMPAKFKTPATAKGLIMRRATGIAINKCNVSAELYRHSPLPAPFTDYINFAYRSRYAFTDKLGYFA
ncbi:hypothetical protein A0256_24020 [Mucilaginibacter sp. PAMC 26640]|nr:hypothetical protein A0256_24020 [Mucilaginibacter sp. PAMC 26640]